MRQNKSDLIDEETYWDIRNPGWREERARQEGYREGFGLTLVELLDKRFGTLPAWAIARIELASIKKLRAMRDKIVGAQTITDVLGPAPVCTFWAWERLRRLSHPLPSASARARMFRRTTADTP